MDRMILPLLGALFLLILGSAGTSFYYTHPPIGWHARVLGIRVVGFDLPDSLLTSEQRALKLAASAVIERDRCDANTLALRSAVTAQNAAVDALGRESGARLARSAKAAQAARAVAQSYRVHADVILQAKPEGDLCAAADRLILREAGR